MSNQKEQLAVTFSDIEKLCLSGQLEEASKMFKAGIPKLQSSTQIAQKIDDALEAKGYLQQGLQAEQDGDISSASRFYKQVLVLFPEHIGARLHLSIIAIQQTSWQEGLEYLQDIDNDVARYLRGYIYYKLGQVKKVHLEWNPIHQSWFEKYKKILQELLSAEVIRQKRLIQLAVDEKRFDEARFLSESFISSVGQDSLVDYNLQNHVIPKLEQTIWKDGNFEEKLTYARDAWIKCPNITTLHNYAVSSYYFIQNAQVLPENFGLIVEAFGCVFTALANLRQDTSLKELPWLNHDAPSQVNYEFITAQVKADLEKVIEEYKSDYSKTYLELKDYYLLEEVALEFIINFSQGAKLKNLYITPILFRLYKQELSFNIKYKSGVVWTYLYTNLGTAVAACLRNNVARAIEIKPSLDVEPEGKYVEDFITYHEGCFYLERNDWNKAKSFLEQLKPITNSDWVEHIDNLMCKQSENISDDNDREKFSKFWYDLLKTKNSSKYLVDCEFERLVEQFQKGEINDRTLCKMLSSLQELLKIDSGNRKVIQMIERIKITMELQQFFKLISQGQIESAINLARASKHQEVRFEVAKHLIECAIKESNKFNPNFHFIVEVTSYAYSIAPNEPEFQPIYRSIGIR